MTVLARTSRLTGPELQERRRDAEVTQAQVASQLAVNRSRIAQIEATAAPSRAAIRRYLSALAEIVADR